MQLKQYEKIEAINILINADGEDMQYILEKIGMYNQMLKQLVFSAKDFDLINVLDEDGILKETCQKIWDDIFNNDTLNYNNFESYWENFIKNLN